MLNEMMICCSARAGCRKLQSLTGEERGHIIEQLADSLLEHQQDIVRANMEDLKKAQQRGVAPALTSRLTITPSKLKSLSAG